MVKFAYYIKFVCSLLGLDMNELIANDLNEVRHYRQMQLALYGINTVAEISPLRTNKVSLSKNELTNMLSESGADDCINIMLCHHSPKYSPDYLLDRYAMWRDNISESEQKEWISEFHKLLQEIDLFFSKH